MQLTREEIKAKIDFIMDNPELFDDRLYYEKSVLLDNLNQQLQSAKSIKDLQIEAFNAAKLIVRNPNFDLDEDDRLYIPKYDNFNDYFNSINNGK